MKKLLAILVIAGLVSACNNSTDSSKTTADSTTMTTDTTTKMSTDTVNHMTTDSLAGPADSSKK